jgi:NMD protein affecting ribosome stability and mRNA decay
MAENKTQRKLTAILSADVKGYSKLMGDDDEFTVTTITAYRKIISDLVDKHQGRVVDTPGCPNRQLMAQRNRENGVTLPSVKTNYTERSETHENEKEETFSRGEERFPDMGVPGGVPAPHRHAFSGRRLQRAPAF